MFIQILIRYLGIGDKYRKDQQPSDWKDSKTTHTGNRTTKARSVAHAARANTPCKLVAYASRATACRSGGSVVTILEECLIFSISYGSSSVSHIESKSRKRRIRTSLAPGPVMLLRSAVSNLDWNKAEDTATPPTCPEWSTSTVNNDENDIKVGRQRTYTPEEGIETCADGYLRRCKQSHATIFQNPGMPLTR